jgi:hypothetical protein
MPSIRIGFSTDFNLTGEQIGIGTTNPTARLDVAGQIVSEKTVDRGGISTVTRYGGFLDESQGLSNTVSIAETTKGNLNSLSGEIKISGEVTVTEDTKLTGGRLDSLTVTGKFDLPHGGSEDREDTPEKGSTRFNQDLGQLEFYTGYEWRTVGSYARPSGSGRAVFGGGYDSANTTNIEYFNMSSQGNGADFGDISFATPHDHGGGANNVRGLFAGNSPYGTPIDYITMASGGNSITFGTLTIGKRLNGTGNANSQRAVFPGGGTPGSQTVTMDTVNISQVANSVDFGDMATAVRQGYSYTTPTRGFYCGGRDPSIRPDVQVFSMSSNGTATEFGDIITRRTDCGGCNNQTKGIVFCGYGSAEINTIESLTISTLGNATDFGEMLESFVQGRAASSNTRAFSISGRNSGTNVNIIAYVNFASSGNAIDFGDLSIARHAAHAFSDSHGGLGGF